jgi:hypothetical protein
MKSFFGGDCKSYFRIDPVQISIYSPRFPRDKEGAKAQLQKNKDDSRAFGEWRRKNNYRVGQFSSKAQAQAALNAFAVQPPVEVEITEYMNL